MINGRRVSNGLLDIVHIHSGVLYLVGGGEEVNADSGSEEATPG